MEYNLWDLDRVNIKIDLGFLHTINKEISIHFKTKRAFYNHIFKSEEIPFSTFKNVLKPSNMKGLFVQLEIYLKVVDALNISRFELQKNIISYKTSNGSNVVENPILPIKIKPSFHALFGHHIGDGTVINPKKGRLPYFGYRQFDEFYRLSFIEKIEDVFGKINYRKDYAKKSTRVYLPPVLSTLFFKHYNLDTNGFLSETSRIPEFIFKENKDNLLAILIAFIIDEGHVDSTQIVINLKNKLLVQDLKKICDNLNYKSNLTYGRGDYLEYARLYISREGMKKLYADYLIFNEQYPKVNLGWKGEKIKKSFEISNRVIKRVEGNEQIIISILKREQLSVNQLAERINMTRQGVRYHIHNLLNRAKIRLIDDKQNNWVYGV